jgi:DNA-directed RNA polymerase subunit RPC12/RpoP
MWWVFTMIFVCHECGYQEEFPRIPDDDSCPKCGMARLWRQVQTEEGLVDYNPNIHKKGE